MSSLELKHIFYERKQVFYPVDSWTKLEGFKWSDFISFIIEMNTDDGSWTKLARLGGGYFAIMELCEVFVDTVISSQYPRQRTITTLRLLASGLLLDVVTTCY